MHYFTDKYLIDLYYYCTLTLKYLQFIINCLAYNISNSGLTIEIPIQRCIDSI